MAAAVAFHPASMRQVHEFDGLSPQEQGILYEWLVAQELFRRAAIEGKEDPQALGFWSSKDHEIDFVSSQNELFEVKLGKSSALDFAWFPKIFPKKRLTVICNTPFETDQIRGITMHQFLLEGPSRMVS